jgi:hypothetical protein
MVKLVYENLNEFVRGTDPKQSLNLGYEGKIRFFFRQYNIPDEDYEVKENGDIIFNTDLNMRNNNIVELPNNLMIKGNLDISDNPIKVLPNNLSIKGLLDLCNTLIIELPNDLMIRGTLNVYTEQKELIKFIKQSRFNNKLIKW